MLVNEKIGISRYFGVNRKSSWRSVCAACRSGTLASSTHAPTEIRSVLSKYDDDLVCPFVGLEFELRGATKHAIGVGQLIGQKTPAKRTVRMRQARPVPNRVCVRHTFPKNRWCFLTGLAGVEHARARRFAVQTTRQARRTRAVASLNFNIAPTHLCSGICDG